MTLSVFHFLLVPVMSYTETFFFDQTVNHEKPIPLFFRKCLDCVTHVGDCDSLCGRNNRMAGIKSDLHGRNFQPKHHSRALQVNTEEKYPF